MNNILNNFNRILFVSPHIEDAELGCGGLIMHFLNLKKEVFIVKLAKCQNVLEENGIKTEENIFLKESELMRKEMGIKKENIFHHNIPDRQFPKYREEIREILYKLSKQINPDLIVGPDYKDLHQDHMATGNELIRAFVSGESIISYEIGKNNISFKPQFFVDISKYIDKKIKILKLHKSQYTKTFNKNYLSEEYIKSLAKIRAVQSRMNVSYCEAFEIIRLNNEGD
jgi:N-acetylglucosamine malate deacetylase 1